MKSYTSLIEYFYDYLLPLAITFGMQTAEFWEEEPELLWAYRKSYMDKKKIEAETINYTAWLNGVYIYDAVATVIHNGFSKEGTRPREYIAQPFEFGLSKEEVEKKKRKQIEDNIRKSLNKKKALIEQGEMK